MTKQKAGASLQLAEHYMIFFLFFFLLSGKIVKRFEQQWVEEIVKGKTYGNDTNLGLAANASTGVPLRDKISLPTHLMKILPSSAANMTLPKKFQLPNPSNTQPSL